MPRKAKDNRWGDIDGGSAFVVPYTLLRHPNFTRLSPFAMKLLMDLARQYTGFNNGYLCTSWKLLRHQGWKSENTLRAAMRELEHYRLIERTQQGGKNLANLHALTWRRIDRRDHQPLAIGPTQNPNNLWKVEQPEFDRTEGTRRAGKTPARTLRVAA